VPSLCGREGIRFKHDGTRQAAKDIDVLHQRQRPETSRSFVNVTADQQSLIAVRQTEQAGAKRDALFDDARLPREIVEAEAKAAWAATALNMPSGMLGPVGREARVRVDEEQGVAARSCCSRGELYATTSCRFDKARAASTRDGLGAVV
jgi:hypothetical protein